MKPHILILWLIGSLGSAFAGTQTSSVQSYSRQFTARSLQAPSLLPVPENRNQAILGGSSAFLLSSRGTPALANADEVTLGPATLVVSCERLKALLLDKLALRDQWRGPVELIINPGLAEDYGPQLTAMHNARGWNYRLELPRLIKEETLMRSLIQTLLLEIANRQAGVQSAEIPLWLVEGLSGNLQANNFPTFIVQPGQNWTSDVRWNKSQTVPQELRQRAPLTFQQLSWPQASDLGPDGMPLYRCCAQLFLEEMLRWDDGRACLCSMIRQLPEHWNWQTAFLLAFHSHFERLLDVEKWWSLTYIEKVSGSEAHASSSVDSRKMLQSCLDVPVEVHFGADQMPVDAKMTLQEVIRQWSPLDARDALQRTAGGLRMLIPQSTPDARLLAELYLKAILDYFTAIQPAEVDRPLGRHSLSLVSNAKANAVKQLDELDRQRDATWHNAISKDRPLRNDVGQPVAQSAEAH